MIVIYRLLGLMAYLSEFLSRIRIFSLIPLNLGIPLVPAILLLASFDSVRENIVNGGKPMTMTLGEVFERGNLGYKYVTVKGVLVSGTGKIPDNYSLLLDPDRNQALLVERTQTSPAQAAPSQSAPFKTQITGVIGFLDQKMRQKLLESDDRIDLGSVGKVPIETIYVLQEGSRPSSATSAIVMLVISGGLLAAFLFTYMNKYIVFQRTGPGLSMPSAAVTPTKPQQGIDLRVTGRFVQDDRRARRFLDMPASITLLKSGELILTSELQALTRVMPHVYGYKPAGTWGILLQPTRLHKVEAGRLYLGWAVRPALRVCYGDARTQRRTTAILSFATEAERLRVQDLLDQKEYGHD